MSDYETPKCTYKKLFPVDEWGRPGGFYSLADVPIANEKVLVREGTVPVSYTHLTLPTLLVV